MNRIAATLDIRRVTALHDEVAEAGVLVSALALPAMSRSERSGMERLTFDWRAIEQTPESPLSQASFSMVIYTRNPIAVADPSLRANPRFRRRSGACFAAPCAGGAYSGGARRHCGRRERAEGT